MLVVKKLFSGDCLNKIHIIKDSSINEQQTNINDNNNNINSNNYLLVSTYESYIDVSKIEFDETLNQYFLSPISHQTFFFVIFDSGVLNSNLVLLTSVGLFILKFDGKNFNIVCNYICNIKCDPIDLLLHLKIENNLIVAYSSKKLFSVYTYDEINCKLKFVNQENFLTEESIQYVNIFKINDVFLITVQTKINNNFFIEIFVYQLIDKDYKEITNDKEICKNEISNIQKLFKIIRDNYSNEKIIYVRFNLNSKYVFLIKETGFIILKNKYSDGIYTADLLIKYDLKYQKHSAIFHFIDYQNQGNKHFLFFDKKICFFEEKDEILSKMKFVPKENKKFLMNFNAIILSSEKNITKFIFYNIKNDLSFIHIVQNNLDENKMDIDNNKNQIEDTNNCEIKIITKITNESMFCFDAAIIKNKLNNKEYCYQIYGICGLKGESRLIKYSNLYNEMNLVNKNINNDIINLVSNNFTEKYKSNLLITSNDKNSILFFLNSSFNIKNVKEFKSPALKIYQINSLNYALILKTGVGIIQFKEENNSEDFEMKSVFECKENISILFSYYFEYENNSYISIYLNNKKLLCFNLNHNSKLFEIELANILEPSALGVIVVKNQLGFIFGNYSNDYNITIFYYDLINNSFNTKDYSKNIFWDTKKENLLTPTDIQIYNYFIFVTTNTGDFIVFKFNENSLDNNPLEAIYLSENITKNKSPLHFSQIELSQIKINNITSFIFNIDFYSYKNAYNMKININKNEIDKIFVEAGYLAKYNLNCKNKNLLNFRKISYVGENSIYFYLEKGLMHFCYFNQYNNENTIINEKLNKILGMQKAIIKNNIAIETIYNFPKNERAIKIITLNDDDNELLILTNNNKLYLFNEKINLISIKDLEKEIKKEKEENLKTKGIKNYVLGTEKSDEKKINLILVYGSISKNHSEKGFLAIFEYEKNTNIEIQNPEINTKIFKPIKIIRGYPKPILDIALIKNYIVCSIEGSICTSKYKIKDEEFEWENKSNQIQYMNKIISLENINKNGNKNYLLAGDIMESFQLLKFDEINPLIYETEGADICTNSLNSIYCANHIKEEVFLTDKKGIVSKYILEDEIYNITNRVDLKELIINLYTNDDSIIMVGLLGSLFYGEIKEKNEISNELLIFQREVFVEVSNIVLKKSLEYEAAMLMSDSLKEVFLIDVLINFCTSYYKELSEKIKNFNEKLQAVKEINDELYLNID